MRDFWENGCRAAVRHGRHPKAPREADGEVGEPRDEERGVEHPTVRVRVPPHNVDKVGDGDQDVEVDADVPPAGQPPHGEREGDAEEQRHLHEPPHVVALEHDEARHRIHVLKAGRPALRRRPLPHAEDHADGKAVEERRRQHRPHVQERQHGQPNAVPLVQRRVGRRRRVGIPPSQRVGAVAAVGVPTRCG